MMRVNQDVAAGLVFAAAGIAGLALGGEYEFGAARAMGPGYLPTVLSWGLICTGLVISGKGLIEDGEDLSRWKLRPLVLVLIAVGIFALTIERTGLFIAVAATSIISSLASDNVRLREAIALALVLAASASAVFVYGLSLPISIMPP